MYVLILILEIGLISKNEYRITSPNSAQSRKNHTILDCGIHTFREMLSNTCSSLLIWWNTTTQSTQEVTKVIRFQIPQFLSATIKSEWKQKPLISRHELLLFLSELLEFWNVLWVSGIPNSGCTELWAPLMLLAEDRAADCEWALPSLHGDIISQPQLFPDEKSENSTYCVALQHTEQTSLA